MKYLGSTSAATDVASKSYVDSTSLSVTLTSSTSITAVPQMWYRVDTTTGSSSVTLPTSPGYNCTVVLENVGTAANNLSYIRGGTTDTIEGSTSNYNLASGEWVELSYNTATSTWYQRRYLASAISGTNMRRDSNGRAQVQNPAATLDIANKAYVDAGDALAIDNFSASYASGEYFALNGQSVSQTSTLTQAREIAIPFYLPITTNIARLVGEVTAAGSTGSVLRLGIRAMASTGYPSSSAPILDAGTFSGTAVAVAEITLGSTLTLSPGWYYYTYTQQGAPTTLSTVRVTASYACFMPGHLRSTAASNVMGATPGGYYQNSVTGALPSTWTTAGLTGVVPKIAVRIA